MLLKKIRPYLKMLSLLLVIALTIAVGILLTIGSRSEINDTENPELDITENSNNKDDAIPEVSVPEETVESYGLYIDDVFIGACASEDDINEALSTALAEKSKALGASKDAKFTNDFEIVHADFNRSTLVTVETLKKLLGCENNGFLFEVKSINGTTDLVLDLSYTVDTAKVSSIKFETIYLDNDAKTKEYSKTLVDGEDGQKRENYRITYLNDKVVSTELLETIVLKNPVAEVVERGIKIGSSMTPASMKIFAVPLHGVITSPYGWRDIGQGWKYHQAIDISGPDIKGKEVVAAGDGVVIKKYYSWGYGNRVEVEHPNGMITTYSHLKSYAVEVGDVVKEGQPLGIVGSTGNSTGTHLHFEVIIDGEKVNPILYLKEPLYED